MSLGTSEDPDAVYRAAASGLERGCDVAIVVRGNVDEPDDDGGDDGDDGKWEMQPPAVRPHLLVPPISMPPPAPPGPVFVSRAARSLDDRISVGGVDFTHVNLLSVGFSRAGAEPTLEWVASAVPEETKGALPSDGLWKTFLVCLALPDDLFWVNLNPDEPDRIIDARLAQTDIGRVMLEADLQLKYDTAEIIDPRKSPRAREYWDRLARIAGHPGKGGLEVSTETRNWIVPGPLRLECGGARAYIVEAKLEVVLESKRFAARGNGKAAPRDKARKAAQDLAEAYVLPDLRERVNSAPEYAALRQAYCAMVLARWCKTQIPAAQMPFSGQVNLGTVPSGSGTSVAWDCGGTYNRYLQSLHNGILRFSEQTDLGQTTYLAGGVDWTCLTFSAGPLPFSANTRSLIADALMERARTSPEAISHVGGRVALAAR